MIELKSITIRNFMSVGNVIQNVRLNNNTLNLVLGENLDQGGDDAGSRNGTGKTTLLNALCYAIYGQALTNIKKNNLINKINSKNMLVTLDFEKNGTSYRIERGRSPNVLKFFVNDNEKSDQDAENESQGDSRDTQHTIDELFGVSHNMFKSIIALNTYSVPFLSMSAGDQREIIEQLLGITLLSEKASRLKEFIKQTKESITKEEFRIKSIEDSNARIKEQIDNFKRRQRLWIKKRDEDIAEITKELSNLANVDIEQELSDHQNRDSIIQDEKKYKESLKWIASIEADNSKQEKIVKKLEKEIALLQDHKCHACGQEIHDSKQEEILKSKEDQKKEATLQLITNETQLHEHTDAVKDKKSFELPKTFYKSVDDAYNHKSLVDNLKQELDRRSSEEDPYAEQIVEMEQQALQEINWEEINSLSNLKDHQDFLLKMLTSKDSFLRKKLIDQNLKYLNITLRDHLISLGLPHKVVFQNDLSVEISQLGQDLDFDNLSRGERNRLILGLSFAFRDLWENLYNPINLLFIDELIDNGLDSAGTDSALGVLKKMVRSLSKSVFLISHKEELIGRVNTVVRAVKENGFTSYKNDLEVQD